MLIHETIAAGAALRLKSVGLCGGAVELHRDPPTTDTALPIVNVTYDLDRAAAVGGPRSGEPNFEHTMTLVVDILDGGRTGAEVMARFATYSEQVMQILLSDLKWAGEHVEGIAGVRQLTERSPEGARIVYRRQLQIDVLHRSVWPIDAAALPNLSTLGVGADLTGDGVADITGEVSLPAS